MRKKKLFKRALAAVLTLTMALGVVPMTAFAADAPDSSLETNIATNNEDSDELVISVLKTADGKLTLAQMNSEEETALLEDGATREAPLVISMIRYTSADVCIRITIPDQVGTYFKAHIKCTNQDSSNLVYYDNDNFVATRPGGSSGPDFTCDTPTFRVLQPTRVSVVVSNVKFYIKGMGYAEELESKKFYLTRSI